MSKPKGKAAAPAPPPDALFGRVASILDHARGHVVRAVDTQMVLAYCLIGREIVLALHGRDKRATYGNKVIKELSIRLVERFGKGFSARNLQSFKPFYLSYSERFGIVRPMGPQLLESESSKSLPIGDRFAPVPDSTPGG